jgi:hypothetical protein
MTTLQLALDGVCELAPGKHRETHQRPEVGDQPIALIFHVEVERLARKDRRASQGPGMSSRKGPRGAFEQKDSSGPPASRASQKPSLSRPMKKAGIDAFRMLGSSGRNTSGASNDVAEFAGTSLFGVELDFTRQLDDRFGMATIFKERILQRLRAADEQPAVKAILFLGYPVAAAVPADEGHC